MSRSKFGFFRSGLITAVFKLQGTQPEDSELITASVMTGANTCKQDFIILVGIGSYILCLGGDELIIF